MRFYLVALCAALLSACAGCRDGGRATAASGPATAGVPPATQGGVFRDVAADAGITFRWGHGGKSPLNIVETIGHGVAFLDYDQDGRLDVFLVGNKRCALFRNGGDGRFTDVTEPASLTAEGMFFGLAVGDYDNDGYPDVYVTGYGKCVLYHNTRRGGFEDVTERAGLQARGKYDVVTACAFADLDGDGRLDLFAGRYIVFTPASLQFCTYQGIRAGCGVKNYDPDFPRVYRNAGDGRFADVTAKWGFSGSPGKCLGVTVRASDSGKGVLLYAANDEQPGNLWTRQNDGRYKDIGLPSGTAFGQDGLTQAGMGADWGDFNNDQKPDLAVATFQSEAKSLYKSDGDNLYTETSGRFNLAPATAYVSWTARFFDFDNDGWLDLFFTNGHVQDNVQAIQPDHTYPQPLQLFRNDNGRVFREMKAEGGDAFLRNIVGRGAAFGDYDNDGRVDVLVVNEEGAPFLLHNESRAGHHWMGVHLIGAGRNNRDGIGARVTITAGTKRWTRDAQRAGGYLSAHDPRVHFGLGDATRADKIEVGWPDGSKNVVRNVAADRYVTVAQSKEKTP